MDAPKTLIEAVRYFSDLDRCEETTRKSRWPGGVPECPECGSQNIGEIKTRRLLRCRDCRRQISTKRGTIFEDSPLGLDKWLVAVWSIANCKNGVSSHELALVLGVTQKTAWSMAHRVRVAMEIDDEDEQRINVARALRSFERLLKRVVSVPKAKVEERIARKKAANIARRAAGAGDASGSAR